jgi:hypothetical protein
MLITKRLMGLALAGAAMLLPGRGAAEPPPPGDFKQLHLLIKPQPGEARWERVPWINLLWEARLKAAAEGKPIFIWSAGGPPGGC